MKENNFLIIVQARQTSSRFYNKILTLVKNKHLIVFLLERLKLSKLADDIVVAIPNTKTNTDLKKLLIKNNFKYFEGSEQDVLERFYKCAKKFKARNIIRITADCPFSDPKMIDEFINIFKKKKVDYLSNGNPATFPDGFDVEIFTFNSLKYSFQKTREIYDREHVTPFIKKNNLFKKFNVKSKRNLHKLRLTLDYKEDFLIIKKIIEYFYPKINFNFYDILKYIDKHKEVIEDNKNFIRNCGSKMNNNEKIWEKAKSVIPGGNMLLSKRPELYLPKGWPTYYKKAKGIVIKSLENKSYKDFLSMGVGTNLLGYSNNIIDNKVLLAVKNGNMSSLNSYEDIELAEKLIDIHKWSDMAKFARSGGEANTIAIRIARAATNKDKVAICGYHGWQDWYLSANLSSKKNLNNHLFNNLNPLGVPKALKNTTFVFQYNNIVSLENILKKHDIGTIKMEVTREIEPKIDFLKKIRKICDEKKIVLIFDECTSGFRETFGGIHKKYKIFPDMMMLGKALGNGYAISAVLGKRGIMEAANSTFISSTMWTERIGTTAALATLAEMEKIKSWEYVSSLGKWLKSQWKILVDKHKLKIQIQGIDSIASFIFPQNNHLAYKTLITQEMLKKNILAANKIFLSTKHNRQNLLKYLEILDDVFFKISKIERGDSLKDHLKFPISYNPYFFE
jgi:glutamate-1-semialdehyde 2,1-aminomutase